MKRQIPLFLLAGVATVTPLRAAFFPNSPTVQNELILCFRGYGANPATQNLGVDIGPAANYSTMDGVAFPVSGIDGAELQSLFGTSLTAVKFSVLGYTQGTLSTGNTLYLTNPTGLPWERQNKAAQNQTSASVVSIIAGFGSLNGSALAGYPDARTISASAINSYTKYVGQGDFGNYQGTVEQDTGSSFAQPVTLNLYKMDPLAGGGQPGTLLGSFQMAPSGAVTYTAVPEPGVTALGLLGLGILALAGAKRTRNSQP